MPATIVALSRCEQIITSTSEGHTKIERISIPALLQRCNHPAEWLRRVTRSFLPYAEAPLPLYFYYDIPELLAKGAYDDRVVQSLADFCFSSLQPTILAVAESQAQPESFPENVSFLLVLQPGILTSLAQHRQLERLASWLNHGRGSWP